jgi:adenosylhomocysteine nucleosidase
MSWGCAAGLSPTLRPGDLCLPASIVDARGVHRAASAGWHQRAVSSLQATFDVHTGPLLTTDRIAPTEADKRSLAEKFGAIAVDMESAAVAAVARERDVPFLAVRAIADPADMPMPPAVLRATDTQGNIRLSVLLGQVLLHPGEAGGLMRLASHFRAALRTLTRTADRMGLGLLLDEVLAA